MDKASFDDDLLQQVYGRSPKCFLMPKARAEEKHHIFKRGYDLGIRPKDPRRKIMSSPYNHAPLSAKSHRRGDIHSPTMRRKLLVLAKFYLFNAGYQPTENDQEFLELANDWLAANGESLKPTHQ